MTETVTSPTQVKLKRVGRGGKWQPWVIQYICELLVIGTPPASIPSIISSSYQMYYGKEPDEVPQVSFVRQCRVIVQVIGETIAAIKLASADKWDQLWTDATTRRQCPFQALIIGLMDSEKKLDPVTVSSCIFLEDETAETTVESILAKVSGIVKGFELTKRNDFSYLLFSFAAFLCSLINSNTGSPVFENALVMSSCTCCQQRMALVLTSWDSLVPSPPTLATMPKSKGNYCCRES